MQSYIKSYSIFIKWTKLLTPLVAILIFSSIFIFGKKDALKTGKIMLDTTTIDLAAAQKITNPQFSGLTNFGDSYVLNALEAMPDAPIPENIDLINPKLNFDAVHGTGFITHSKSGSVNFLNQSAQLNGDVFINIENGYKAFSEKIRLNLELGYLIAPEIVYASGPSGKIIAGSMEIQNITNNDISNKAGDLRFFNGVRLFYLPSTVK